MDACLDRYGGLVWSIARRLCRNTSEAEDAVQEAFMAIWKSAGSFDETKSAENTFVAMVARRRIIDRQRSAMRRPSTEQLDDNVSTDSKVGADLEVLEEATRARRMMGHLRDDERRVLELAVDHGLSQNEISQQTGIPLGTVKTHARRGMLRLRELLTSDNSTIERGTKR